MKGQNFQSTLELEHPFNSPCIGMWQGQSCFIVGGGASLRFFDFDNLKNRNVIAINKAYKFIDHAEVLFWCDRTFWRECGIEILEHPAKYKITISTSRSSGIINNPQITMFDGLGTRGLDVEPGRLMIGKNSGYAAINLAFHFGVKRIFLLGYDMKEVDGRSHFHEGYDYNYSSNKLKGYSEMFQHLVEPLDDHGVEVYNVEVGDVKSNLETFPKVNLIQALQEDDYNSPKAEALSKIINEKNYLLGAEVGVAWGCNFFSLLDKCPKVMMFAIDSWDKRNDNKYFCHSLNKKRFFSKMKDYKNRVSNTVCEFSELAAHYFKDESLDFVFIDAGHSFEEEYRNINLWKKKVRKGGMISGHDYDRQEVKKAVHKHFPNANELPDRTWMEFI